MLILTLTFDLSAQNHVTCRISQRHFLYQVWTVWDHSVLSYAPTISVKNALIDPVTLTFQPNSMSLLVYPKVISYTKFENFGIICFLVFLRDEQTDKQIDSKTLPMPTEIVSIGN